MRGRKCIAYEAEGFSALARARLSWICSGEAERTEAKAFLNFSCGDGAIGLFFTSNRIPLAPYGRSGVSIIPMATPNALFAIMSVSAPAMVEAKLNVVPQWLHLKLQEGQWLLVAPPATTSKEVSDALGITGELPPISSAIVLRVESYFGRNPTSVWEWISAKRGAELDTTKASV